MTRINANISPKCLTDQHLLAEHREIKRICDLYSKRMAKGGLGEIPKEFCLGKGHVSFFLDKGNFTLGRYHLLYLECLERGFNIEDYRHNWWCYSQYANLDHITIKNWNFVAANQLIKERIKQRLKESTEEPRYYRKIISVDEAIKILENG